MKTFFIIIGIIVCLYALTWAAWGIWTLTGKETVKCCRMLYYISFGKLGVR